MNSSLYNFELTEYIKYLEDRAKLIYELDHYVDVIKKQIVINNVMSYELCIKIKRFVETSIKSFCMKYQVSTSSIGIIASGIFKVRIGESRWDDEPIEVVLNIY